MSKIMMWVGTILLAAVPTFASVAVGTCKPSLPSYPTILDSLLPAALVDRC